MLIVSAAALLLANAPAAPLAEDWLKAELRRREPTVTEWRLDELLPSRGLPEILAERYDLGPVGARTLVVEHGHDATGRPVVLRRWFSVAGLAPGLVTTRAVSAHTLLTADLLAVVPVDRMEDRCPALPERTSAVGTWLVQVRRKGEPICASMLMSPPAVTRGGSVTVEVTAGAVLLRTSAIARADGYIGDRVGLYRLPAGEVFFGVVTAPGEVSVND